MLKDTVPTPGQKERVAGIPGKGANLLGVGARRNDGSQGKPSPIRLKRILKQLC